MNNNSEKMVSAVKECLDLNGWRYTFDPEERVIQFDRGIRGQIKRVWYKIKFQDHDFNVYCTAPVSADDEDEEQLRQMMEFVCRANYGMRDGNFELDVNDGEIRFKTYVNCDGIEPSQEIVEKSIQIPAAMFTRYSKGIISIIFKDMSAQEAIDLTEGDIRSFISGLGTGSDEDETSEILSFLRKMRGEMEGDLEELEGENLDSEETAS